uniref:Uncharacterized protein n=1 Tax=Cacopsylla melanoneura TaxID=428564 RepID=A0A8D8SS41_9HEMI
MHIRMGMEKTRIHLRKIRTPKVILIMMKMIRIQSRTVKRPTRMMKRLTITVETNMKTISLKLKSLWKKYPEINHRNPCLVEETHSSGICRRIGNNSNISIRPGRPLFLTLWNLAMTWTLGTRLRLQCLVCPRQCTIRTNRCHRLTSILRVMKGGTLVANRTIRHRTGSERSDCQARTLSNPTIQI